MAEAKYGSEAICPHCDREQSDTWELFLRTTSETQQMTCGDCERQFEVDREISVDYTSRPIKEGVHANS